MHDEELAAGGIRVHGPGHGDDAAAVLEGVLGKAVVAELAFDLIAGAADADSLRAAALDHEAGDDPVEDEAVVEALIHQVFKVVDRVGSVFGQQFDLDLAAILHFDDDHFLLLYISCYLSEVK